MFVMALGGCTAATLRAGSGFLYVELWKLLSNALLAEVFVFCPDEFAFILASLPAVTPVTYEKSEAERVDFRARLKADAEVSIIHLVFFCVSEEEREMACNSEQQVIMERGKVRKRIYQFWRRCCQFDVLILAFDALLKISVQHFIRKFAEPCF